MRNLFYALIIMWPLTLSLGAQGNKKTESQRADILAAVKDLDSQQPEAERKVLICSVTRGYRHKSIPVGQLAFEVLGKETGAFQVVVSDDLKYFEPEQIKQFDAICFLNTTREIFSPGKKELKSLSEEELKEWKEREKRLKKSLMSHLKSGKGFIGIHSATDTFYEWPEYGKMIGAYFDGHPWSSKTEVQIKIPDESQSHPLVSHLEGENLVFNEEIYQYKEEDIIGGAEVLMKLDPHKNSFKKSKRKDSKYVPVSWTKEHEGARVFYSSLGHNDHIFMNEKVLQHFLSGIQWAIGDLKVK